MNRAWRYYTIVRRDGGPMTGPRVHWIMHSLLGLQEPYGLLFAGFHGTLRLPPGNSATREQIAEILHGEYAINKRQSSPPKTVAESDDALVMHCTMARNDMLRTNPLDLEDGLKKAVHLILNPWGYEVEAMVTSWMGKQADSWQKNYLRTTYGEWERRLLSVTKGSRKTAKRR